MQLELNLVTIQNLFLIMAQEVNLAITPINQTQNLLPITTINLVVMMEVIVNPQIIVNPHIILALVLILVLVLNPLVVQDSQDLLLVEVDQVVNLEADLEDINAVYKYHLNF